MELARFGIDAATLAGSLPERLSAIAQVGLSRIVLSAKDLVGYPHGIDAASALLRQSPLQVAGFQGLRDFEGLAGHQREYKLGIAKSLLEMMRGAGCRLLVVSSSSSPRASGDERQIAEDLKALSTLATPFGIRIGYEAVSWGRWINEYPQAWDIVRSADRENLGLVVDSFHMLAARTPLERLNEVDADRIFLVQLSESMWDYLPDSGEELVDTARHHRVFPGEGAHRALIADLVRRLEQRAYRGAYVFEVFNDDYLHCPPATVCGYARKSAQWLAAQLREAS